MNGRDEDHVLKLVPTLHRTLKTMPANKFTPADRKIGWSAKAGNLKERAQLQILPRNSGHTVSILDPNAHPQQTVTRTRVLASVAAVDHM